MTYTGLLNADINRPHSNAGPLINHTKMEPAEDSFKNFPVEDDELEDKVVETSPCGRYVRFADKLGVGAFKTVFRALDTELGIEVAWNRVEIDRVHLDKTKILHEINIFQKIRHEKLIEFYHFWINEIENEVVFITELMPSGTLKEYIKKSPEVKVKIIKSWCKQILLGLNYLHTREPPIIHRDIKCDNIFINGTTEGEVKIGDLGLATFCERRDSLSVIGTPEFMAPEYYTQNYTTAVDIWAFGMAIIEMVVGQCPYAGDNVGQIFQKVTSGILPPQLESIDNQELRNFVELCLAPANSRPSAAQLLAHEFFTSGEPQSSESTNHSLLSSSNEVIKPVPISSHLVVPATSQPPSPTIPQFVPVENKLIAFEKKRSCSDPQVILLPVDKNLSRDSNLIEMKLLLEIAGEHTEIKFEFNLCCDTADSVTREMVEELQLTGSHEQIRSLIQEQVQNYQKLAEKIDGSPNSSKAHTPLSLSSEDFCSVATLKNSNAVTDLEFLADALLSDEIDQIPVFTVPPLGAHDMTDLEDLLDDEEFPLDESDHVGGEDDHEFDLDECVPSVGASDSDDNDLSSSSSDDEAEIAALRAKHEKALLELRKLQAQEMLEVTKRQQKRRALRAQLNSSSSVNDGESVTQALQAYYKDHPVLSTP